MTLRLLPLGRLDRIIELALRLLGPLRHLGCFVLTQGFGFVDNLVAGGLQRRREDTSV